MFNKKKNRILRKRIRRIAIVGIPIILLCVVSYALITSLLRASDTTYASRQFQENGANSGESDEPNSQGGENVESDSKDSQVITSHDNLVPDRDPSSLTVIVNKELSLPSDYVPEDLVVPDVPFSISYYDEKKLLRQAAADALEELFSGASADGISLTAVSGYRSYDRQYEIFTSNIKSKGLTHTLEYSAIPGYSEHQTGLAIDVSAKSVSNRLDATLADSTEGKWLAEHAYEYGYIIRYPEDKVELTGYSYEPWHIRYVGKALAKYLYENNLCLEEYYNVTPSTDYSDITLDTLVSDYGIKMADMIEPTRAPVKVVEETNTEEDTGETAENTADSDTNSLETNDQTIDSGSDTGNSDNTAEDGESSNEDDGISLTPTITPAGADSNSQTLDTSDTDTGAEETKDADTLTPTPDIIAE